MENIRLTMITTFFVVASVVGAVLVPNWYLRPWREMYQIAWGKNHTNVLNKMQVELLLDQSSGAGLRSRIDYLSGLFALEIKLPTNMSPGVVLTFKMTSKSDSEPKDTNHYEFTFEFIGTNNTPYLNTYMFLNDFESRKQSFHLWFDPTTNFHSYVLTWNAHMLWFTVDNIPIRVFKNNTNFGVNYPTVAIHSETSLWNPEWARKVDWAKGPFKAQYEGFVIAACAVEYGPEKCADLGYIWNNIWNLTEKEHKQYNNIKKNFRFYDYCASKPLRSANYLNN